MKHFNVVLSLLLTWKYYGPVKGLNLIFQWENTLFLDIQMRFKVWSHIQMVTHIQYREAASNPDYLASKNLPTITTSWCG